MNYTVIHPTDRNNGVRGKISSPLTITGFVPMHYGQSVRYEGPNERDFLQVIDFHPHIKAAWPQPIEFRLNDIPGKIKYTPDYLVEFSPVSGMPAMSPILVEVKQRIDLIKARDKLLPGFRAAIDYCRREGWRFRIVTDTWLNRPKSMNARFLWSFRSDNYAPDIANVLAIKLRKAGSAPVIGLVESCYQEFEDQMLALAVVWHMLATRRFGTNLNLPLNNNSIIWEVRNGAS